MNVPKNLLYTPDHEWVRVSDDFIEVGITEYAQSELGDIVFVEFPQVGDEYKKGDVFGTIEAVKTVADLYMPVTGEIIGINDEVESEPENVNNDPYSNGWLIKIKISSQDELSDLLISSEYEGVI